MHHQGAPEKPLFSGEMMRWPGQGSRFCWMAAGAGEGNLEGEALWLPLFNNFMTLFLANASQDDADLVLGGMVLARSMANIAHQLFGRHTGGWSGGFQIASLVP
jgi:hypothetical protein